MVQHGIWLCSLNVTYIKSSCQRVDHLIRTNVAVNEDVLAMLQRLGHEEGYGRESQMLRLIMPESDNLRMNHRKRNSIE